MDTGRTAIAYFEEAIRESEEAFDQCSPSLRRELAEQIRHFRAALEALKKLHGDAETKADEA